VSVQTELSRKFGRLEHRIAPRAEVWAGTAAARLDADDPFPAYDPWDRVATRGVPDPANPLARLPVLYQLTAAPDGAYTQLRLALENRLDAGAAGHLGLEVGQDLDLGRGELAETFVAAGGVKGPFRADLNARFLAFGERPTPAPAARYRSALDDFTELRASLALADARGDALRASLFSLGPGGSGTAMAGVDALFDLRPAALGPVAQGSVGVRAVLGGATLGYDALLPARPMEVDSCDGQRKRRVEAWQIQQHAASFVWDSPCRCFLARVVVRLTDCGDLSYSAMVDLSKLAERGAFR
jgi:LPS-assembly protein